MRPSEIMSLFRECGAWQDGHFLLTSGQHSREYFQCALIMQYPTLSSRLCQALAQRFIADEATCVLAPAVGGILVAYETARHLGGIRAVYAEREEGKLKLRRTFHVGSKDRVLLVEDVVTTGGSVQELMHLVQDRGAEVVGVGALVDRSGGWTSFDVKYHALVSANIKTFPPDYCPLCKEGIPMVKPGSRGLV